MRKFLLSFLFLASICTLPVQVSARTSANLTVAATSTCSAPTSGAFLIVPVDTNVGGVALAVSTNAGSNTISWFASGDGGTTWTALNATPPNSTTPATTTTGTGTWQANVAGYTHVCIEISTLSSGSNNVSISPSSASARSGGGGGSTTPAYPVTVTGGVSGAVPCFTSTTTESAGTLLATNALVVGGGAGVCPSTGNGDFTYATHTLTAGASGLVDLSAEASGGFKFPSQAGCTAVAAGNICYDSTGSIVHTFQGNADRVVVTEATAAQISAGVIPRAFGSTGLQATSLSDDLKDITSTEIASFGNRVVLTSDFTDSTSTTLQLISNGAGNELKWTLPVSKALNVGFHCNLLYDQATALVSDSFGIGVTGTAPTQANASGVAYITTSTLTEGTLTGLASTTPTAVVTFTPGGSVATIYNAEIDGTIEQPSNATPGVFGIYVATTTGTDNIIVKRGSYCSLF